MYSTNVDIEIVFANKSSVQQEITLLSAETYLGAIQSTEEFLSNAFFPDNTLCYRRNIKP